MRFKGFLCLVAGAGFEPHDLRVMSPTSYRTALPRDDALQKGSADYNNASGRRCQPRGGRKTPRTSCKAMSRKQIPSASLFTASFGRNNGSSARERYGMSPISDTIREYHPASMASPFHQFSHDRQHPHTR